MLFFIARNKADTTIPVITLLGDTIVEVVQGDIYTDAGATAIDDVDGDITGNIVTVNNVDTATIGSYTVTYNVSDAAGNNATQRTRTVKVVANATAPIFLKTEPLVFSGGKVYLKNSSPSGSIYDAELVYVGDGSELAGTPWTPSATEYPQDGTIDFKENGDGKGSKEARTTWIPTGEYVKDFVYDVVFGTSYKLARLHDKGNGFADIYLGDNNTTIALSETNKPYATPSTPWVIGVNPPDIINPPDTTIPVITLLGGTIVEVVQGDIYTDAGATAIDDVDGDITGNIVTVNNVDTATIGSYTVTYNVSDAAGNSATQVSRTVNVVSSVVDIFSSFNTTLWQTSADGVMIYSAIGNTFNFAVITPGTNVFRPSIKINLNKNTINAGNYQIRFDAVINSGQTRIYALLFTGGATQATAQYVVPGSNVISTTADASINELLIYMDGTKVGDINVTNFIIEEL